uniref:Venom allergen 5 n=1 Tax=Dolichovespula arenaria TaxID=7442 RepID=VA5_DOLAR
NNYCKICPKGTHTLCKYGTSMKPNCGGKIVKSYGVTNDEKNEIVKRHNEFRQKVAQGLETRGNPGPQPPAKNMNLLVWNDELAKIAQTWANQCNFGHDQCRNTAKYPVGQNVAIASTTGNSYQTMSYLIKMWEDEVKDYNPHKDLMHNNFSKVGHYTQMVWGKTKEIGCGSVKYIENKWHTHYLVCNYGPAGNYMNQPVYERK